MMIGSTVASFCVEDVGFRGVERLTQDHVRRRLEELRSMIHLPL